MAPTVLAERYELGETLGRGGMADVHRARDRVLGREVAVKVLRDTATDSGDRQRFTAEARTLARLSHPHLVMLLDAGIDNGADAGHPFLVMELVTGPTLAQRLQDGPLTKAEVARLGSQLAEALAYAHDQGVVHRDVKPANVLLGADDRTKLADFGIARLLGDSVRHTRTGTTVGTAAYLAPEQVRGEDVTGAADVYSLGLVLLEALTGERAYPGGVAEAAMARLHRAPEIPSGFGRGGALLAAMTALDPADRPSPAEVASTFGGPTSSAAAPAAPPATSTTAVMDTSVLGAGATAPLAAEAPPAVDRAGDSLTRHARTGWHRARAAVLRDKEVSGAVAALVLLLLIVGVVASCEAGAETGTPADAPTSESPSPTEDQITPEEQVTPEEPAEAPEKPGKGKGKSDDRGKPDDKDDD